MVLSDAIEELYAVFANYRAGRVPGCPCCVGKDEQERLHARRLRDLTREDLEHFSFSALNTWGTLKDLKHFLPRILELYARRELSTDLQTIYGKVQQEETWPETELDALARFTTALFAEVVGAGRAWDVAMIIESAGILGMDVRALVDAAFEKRPLEPTRATVLAELVTLRERALASDASSWIWWKSGDTRALEAWLVSGRAHAALLSAFEANPDHPHAREWAGACDMLEALGGAQGSL